MSLMIFKRYETKYLITGEQYRALMGVFAGRMAPDRYGTYAVANLYYDTEGFDLIRTSLEKPAYKEKLRLRSYGGADENEPVFLELKKKYQDTVYKRRVRLPYREAEAILSGGGNRAAAALSGGADSQILREILWFLSACRVSAKVFLCYDRTAFTGLEDEDLRITFDSRIRFRLNGLRLDSGFRGTEILEPGTILLEVKTPGAIPLWLCRALSGCGIFPSSFSKYGTCYRNFIARGAVPEENEVRYA